MAIHRALKKTSSPRTSSAKRTKRAAAAVQSVKRTTRSPSSRKSTSPPSSSSSSSTPSPSPKRRRSTGSPSSERWRTTRDQRNVVVARSPAIASYSDAGVRCSYCRTALRADNRHGGLGLSNFRRHLVDQHPEGTFVEGPIGELEVLGMRHAHALVGEKPCKLADSDDYEREGLGTAALAAQDEADKKDAAETLLSFSQKLVLFTASEIPPRFRVASDEQL